MKPTVYLDATIPSFYYEDRPGTVMQAWREITVEFWEQARARYDVFVSDETLRELESVPEAPRPCTQGRGVGVRGAFAAQKDPSPPAPLP